jgi:hypothetical protein
MLKRLRIREPIGVRWGIRPDEGVATLIRGGTKPLLTSKNREIMTFSTRAAIESPSPSHAARDAS